MINKISKIKNLGIFRDYHWDPNVPEFKRYNLFYGWNGTGKTTLSQLFGSFSSGQSEEHPELEYKIETTAGSYTHKSQYNIPIRVFNRDYITANLDINSGKAKSIYLILGETNKLLAEIIKQDELILKGDPEKKSDLGLIKELDLNKKELDRRETEKGKIFSNVAKIISTNTSGVSARNYRKNNAEIAFSGLLNKQILSDEKIAALNLTLKQQEEPTLSEFNVNEIIIEIEATYLKANVLMQQTVETVIIDRLKDNPEISKWVEQGIALHSNPDAVTCEFCNQNLPPNRMTQLLAYFNDADKKLKDDIDLLINAFSNIIISIETKAIQDKANLYGELHEEYIQKCNDFLNHKDNLIKNLSKIKDEIENKKINTTTIMQLQTQLDTKLFLSNAEEVNVVISKHNKKTGNFSDARKVAIIKLEKHFLSEIYDEVIKINEDIIVLNEKIKQIEKGIPDDSNNPGIEELKKRINKNKNKISSSGAACDEFNKQLKIFLGRDELTFEVVEGGYKIKRKEKIAKNLSEGEKTAIAFIYFTIHLQDQDFDLKNGIIVIDDPVCSFDSNSIFQAFAFLKNTVKDAKQVFLFTHNYDFLRLLLRWLNYHKTKSSSEFYMIKNHFESEKRVAFIDCLDKLLKEHETEYQYLFKLLYSFKSDGTITSVYHIPNIARKVLENFLMIMIPNNQNLYTKLEKIDFDEIKKTAIYKFANDQSHITGKGFDPSLIPECQNNVAYLLEMIKEVFPEHNKILVESFLNNGGNRHV
jgi:wobble nucleotide-excising tRNase